MTPSQLPNYPPEGWTTSNWHGLRDESRGPGWCWPVLFDGGVDGYAVAKLRSGRLPVRLARLALEERLGRPIAPGMEAGHRCDNRRCVNPDHMEEVTHAENMRGCAARGRNTPGGGTRVRTDVVVWLPSLMEVAA